MVSKEQVIQQRKAEKKKKFLESIVLGVGLFMMFGILIFPGLKEGMYTVLNVILGPIADAIANLLITILFLSVLTGVYTSVILKYTMNWEMIANSKQYQKQIRELQKELMEAKKEDNKHRLKRAEKKKEEVMRKQMEITGDMFKQQMKPMIYIGIFTIPIFMWLWQHVAIAPIAPVVFPLIGVREFCESFVFGIPYWILWYMVCSIPAAQVIRKSIGIPSMS